MRVGYSEDIAEKVVRYLNSLRFDIQYELSLVCPTIVDEAYKYELKVEERNKKLRVIEGSIVLEVEEDIQVARVIP